MVTIRFTHSLALCTLFAIPAMTQQKIGMNTLTPVHPVHINQPTGLLLFDFEPVLHVEYTGTNGNHVIAMRGVSEPSPGQGFGGYFKGGFAGGAFEGGQYGIYSVGFGIDDNSSYGINGEAIQNGASNTTLMGIRGYGTGANSTNYGTNGEADGENSSNYGARGSASGIGSVNYGIYGSARDGDVNWAGYFQNGNVYVHNKLGIGTTTPTAKLQVNGTLKVTDGTQGAGKVLTSDATGLASWQPPPTPPPTYYPTVSICCQSWMTKNLDVATYRNGDPIPKVTSNSAWGALTTGAYCYYNNDSTTYAATYGKLYNFYAVNDPRGLAPEGWHIPSDFEFATLSTCLGGNTEAGGPLKETGTIHWDSPNTEATNITNFTGLPGGYRRDDDNSFSAEGTYGIFRSTSNTNWFLVYDSEEINQDSFIGYSRGTSIRCIKD